MEYQEIYDLIVKLPVGDSAFIFKDSEIEVYIIRPIDVFKKYDVEKNFQVFMKEGERKFRPNHLRVMIDLYLRVRSRPDLKKQLLLCFDRIYYKENPIKAIEPLIKESFEHYISPISITAILSQLFLIEQDYNYTKKSNYNPSTLFYQGWVRQILDSNKEIDNLLMSICRFQSPLVKYTRFEDRNHRCYKESIVPLWYLET